ATGAPAAAPAGERSRRARDQRFSDLVHHPLLAGARRLSRRLELWAFGHYAEEAFRSLWRSRVWTAFAIGIIGLSLATTGAFLLVAENLGGLVARMGSLEVSVYLADRATAADA